VRLLLDKVKKENIVIKGSGIIFTAVIKDADAITKAMGKIALSKEQHTVNDIAKEWSIDNVKIGKDNKPTSAVITYRPKESVNYTISTICERFKNLIK
jgi:hypothetical protein